jgi:hypothetical protein
VRVVNTLISADKANIEMPFKRAAAIDLAGRDVLEAVKMSVISKVIETPRIAAVAKDGIQLIAVPHRPPGAHRHGSSSRRRASTCRRHPRGLCIQNAAA